MCPPLNPLRSSCCWRSRPETCDRGRANAPLHGSPCRPGCKGQQCLPAATNRGKQRHHPWDCWYSWIGRSRSQAARRRYYWCRYSDRPWHPGAIALHCTRPERAGAERHHGFGDPEFNRRTAALRLFLRPFAPARTLDGWPRWGDLRVCRFRLPVRQPRLVPPSRLATGSGSQIQSESPP